MAKRNAGQLPLDAAVVRRKGSTERAAEKDLRTLRNMTTIGAGMAALEVTFRLTAREVDRAETEHDRWGKLKASSELRALRERIAPITPITQAAEADEYWRQIAAMAAAAGLRPPEVVHPTEP
ncbi:MAG: hypothetical protein JWN99_2559 [Ilumatobacteraceae bacterium]|nr:hypothetical protein [Ilumatobacteraceae bacterium]